MPFTELGDLLHLRDVLPRQVRTLSTGTVHRLGLARALLHRPSVLILDEPTRSLDPFAAAEFRRFLRDEVVRKQGTTLFFATHTLAEAEFLADRSKCHHGKGFLRRANRCGPGRVHGEAGSGRPEVRAGI